MTEAEFLENSPLYVEAAFGDYWSTPGRISRYCEGCGKETTWHQLQSAVTGAPLNLYGYACGLCNKTSVWFLVFTTSGFQEKPVKRVKVGQHPAPSISIPSPVQKRLGTATDLYRKALVCLNQGYGLAAVAYFRRIVEDKTNELIDVVAEAARSYGTDEKVLAALRGAKEQRTTFDQKLRIAAEAIPDSLKPDGANALGVLYELLSDGVHGKSEDECVKIAQEIRDVFEYVFVNLKAEVDDRDNFVARIKKWAGRRGVT